MILKGYIDESYNKKMFTLSCLMSDRWAFIESAWKRCLREKNKSLKQQGRQQISRYHAADCSSLKGEFKDWTVAEQVEFVKKLIVIFRRNFVNVIAYSMPLEAFVNEFPECKADPIKTCYSELLKFLMLEMADQIKGAKKQRGAIKPVHFVLFHDRGNYDVDLLQAFNKMMNDPTFHEKEMFSTIAPLSWEHCIPLQAADLVAYENFKDSERRLTGRKRRKSFDFILEMESFGGRGRIGMAQILLHKQELTDEQKNQLAAQGVIAIRTDKPKNFKFLDIHVPQIQINDMVWACLDAANTDNTYSSEVRRKLVDNLAKLAAKHVSTSERSDE